MYDPRPGKSDTRTACDWFFIAAYTENNRMRNQHGRHSWPFRLALLVAVAGVHVALRPAAAQDPTIGKPGTGTVLRAENLNALLEPIRKTHDIPALAAIVVRSDGVAALGAVGVRENGSETLITPNDLFHLGSCTKAMTATLCAVLVEKQRLTWDRKISDAFPALLEKIHPEYQDVTLKQLLCHRGGLPEDRKPNVTFLKLRLLTGEIKTQRLKLVELTLDEAPGAPPGSKFIYSNAGYTIAAAMAEQATGNVLGRPDAAIRLRFTGHGVGGVWSAGYA